GRQNKFSRASGRARPASTVRNGAAAPLRWTIHERVGARRKISRVRRERFRDVCAAGRQRLGEVSTARSPRRPLAYSRKITKVTSVPKAKTKTASAQIYAVVGSDEAEVKRTAS